MQQQATHDIGGISYDKEEMDMIEAIGKMPDGKTKENLRMCFKAGTGKPFPAGKNAIPTDKLLG